MLPLAGINNVIGDAAYEQRRGQVEIIIKSNYDAIRHDIRAGGGPVLIKAMDAAAIPQRDRPTRVVQLQSDIGLYNRSQGALITTPMVYGT